MGSLRDFLIDVGRNAYGLGENVASLGSAAIAEPVAGFAAMYDPTNGAQAIREGMTYQPRTEAGRMYQQGAATTLGAMVKPAMPVIDAWQRGVDIAGRYSPMAGAALQTVPTALGVALGAKSTLQAGRQASNTLGAMQARMIANANAPRTLNTGFMGQRGAINPSDFNLITNPDGTVTLYHGTTNEAAKKIIQDKKLLSAGEPDVYMTTDPMAGYGDGTVVQLNIDPKHLFLDDEFPSGRVDFRMPSVKGWRIQQPKIYEKGGFMGQRGVVGTQRPLTEFEQAHLIAQQNAALPVSQGGLGLAPDNTAMDRARAMGFDAEAYHGTNTVFDGFNASGWSSTSPSYADNIASRKAMLQGGNEVNIPLLVNNENAMRVNSQRAPLSIVDEAKNSGYSGVVGDGFYINSPKDIRSRFAAFDPFNRDSSNLLAQSAKLAPAATLGAYMANEKRKEKRN